MNVLYSTPSIYTNAKNAAKESWPLKTDDYFPYADSENAYWNGYFTSRPALKRYVRILSGYYLTETVVNSGLYCIFDSSTKHRCASPSLTLSQCQLLNITYCPPTEQDILFGKSLVQDKNLVVRDSLGAKFEVQYVEVDSVTSKLRIFYAQTYLGTTPKQAPKYWIIFQAYLPPLGWNTYFVSKASPKGKSRSPFVSVFGHPQNETVEAAGDTIEIGLGNLKMSFSSASGQLTRMSNVKTGVDLPVQQSYLWYGSSNGGADNQASGAYIFRPYETPPTVVSRSVSLLLWLCNNIFYNTTRTG